MPSTDRVRFGDQGRRTTRFERWRGGETGAFLAVAAQEIALGPTWWYLGFLVVCGVLMVGCLYSVFTTLVTGAGFVAAQFSTVHFANGLALKAARYAQAGTALVAFVDYAMSIRPGGACHAK